MNSPAPVAANNTAQNRYELRSDETVLGFASYRLEGDDTVVFVHTAVEPQQEGKGYGSRLARGALDDVRASGKKVVAQCAFIAGYIDGHPEYRDLLK
jgi:predicted GNAT family acetyltransferase